MKIQITITNSKIMAYALLASALWIDFAGDRSGTVFMFVTPFIVTLIAGKQYLDKKNETKAKT